MTDAIGSVGSVGSVGSIGSGFYRFGRFWVRFEFDGFGYQRFQQFEAFTPSIRVSTQLNPSNRAELSNFLTLNLLNPASPNPNPSNLLNS